MDILIVSEFGQANNVHVNAVVMLVKNLYGCSTIKTRVIKHLR